jgi:hypothetical protein
MPMTDEEQLEFDRMKTARDSLLITNARLNVKLDELLQLEHNNEVLMNALWKACGDDEQVVKDTIESQGELR